MLVFIFINPIQTESAVLNWENPNSKVSPYKIKATDIINTDLFGQILGCTNFVNNISGKMTNLTAAAWDFLIMKGKLEDKVKSQCEKAVNKLAGVVGATETSQTPSAGKATAIQMSIADICGNQTAVKTNAGGVALVYKMKQESQEKAQMDYAQCLKGVAFTLAKNQLTSMARYAINWVNTGFGGDPFFVQNTKNFLYNVERGVFEEALNYLMPTQDGAYPYSNAFARSFVRNNSFSLNHLKSGGLGALQDLVSTMSYFITDMDSYVSTEKLENKKLASIEKSKRAVDLFYNDFNTGGWNGWFAFTQNDANNPLGYAMRASDIIWDNAQTRTLEVKEELLQNNGFLSQKMCVEYEKPKQVEQIDYSQYSTSMQAVLKTTSSLNLPEERKCIKWKTVTPGSIIKDKISFYLNSPERQLEMANDINHVLNSVFSMLVSKLESQGLSDMNSREKFIYDDDRFNWTSSLSTSMGMADGESLTTGYTNGSFDLTRDLGNRFIFGTTKENELGTWDAYSNIATQKNGAREKLIEGRGPIVINSSDEINYPSGVYYVVNKAGRAKLFDNGYTLWEVGDRAFWDGVKWQNWKKCRTDIGGKCIADTFPIKKRGVIQIQYDYIVAAKEMLQRLPTIMPKIGELDYCLPGPNRSWLLNIEEYQDSLTNLVYSLKTSTTSARWFKRGYTEFNISKPGDDAFDNYLNIFKKSPSMLSNVSVGLNDMVNYGFGKISNTSTWKELVNTGNMRTQKINLIEKNLIEKVDMLLSSVEDGIDQFEKDYSSIVDFLYGPNGLVNIEYFLHEDTAEKIPNTAYLPVGKVAYPITGQIVDYDEQVSTRINEYRDNIATVQAGVYELEKIKVEVDKIIKAAQQRRDARMLEILNNEAVQSGQPSMTENQYKNKYAECLETEQIIFYDDLQIMNSVGIKEDRCDDGLDNDFDGLTDSLDPDCFGFSGNPTRGSGTTTGGTTNGPGTAFGGGGDDAFGSNNSGNQGGDNNAFVR